MNKYLSIDKAMSKAFRDWEATHAGYVDGEELDFDYRPGLYSDLRKEVLDEVAHRLAAAERKWSKGKIR